MKRLNIRCVLTLSVITCLTFSIYARNPSEVKKNENHPVTFEASYVADNINNISGGIKTGSAYLGMANIILDFNTEIAGLWKGGKLFFNVANTHGDEPSKYLLGDVQVLSNIEAGNHTYLQEFWFKQKVKKTEIIAGLQDLNDEFANSEYGALYLNSSFGILPTISNNFNAPIFPLTTMGITCKWNTSKEFTWINALYDGSPVGFNSNPYNLKWQFNSGDGLLIISEIQRQNKTNRLPGVYKLGAYSHFHKKGKNIDTPDSLTNSLLGLYAFFDQTVWIHEYKSAGFFGQLGYSPSAASTNNIYIGSGVNFTGLLCKKAKDMFGIAFAHVVFTRNKHSETAIELTYQYQFSEQIFIQPDLQYIIHPSGTNESLPNALAANFRFGFNF